jgi:threonine dehydrogenase-like Zn-dependent dehydrogenase
MCVTANFFGECEQCFYCQRGQGSLCEKLKYNSGAIAEYGLNPSSIVRWNLFIITEQIAFCPPSLFVKYLTIVDNASLFML